MNLPTILVLCAVIALVALVIFKMIRDKKQGKQEHSDDGNGSQSRLPQQLSVDAGQDEAKNGTNKQNDSVSPADAKIINAAGAGIIGKVVQKTVDINDAVDAEYDRKKQDEARYDQQYEGECSFH